MTSYVSNGMLNPANILTQRANVTMGLVESSGRLCQIYNKVNTACWRPLLVAIRNKIQVIIT